MNLVTLPDGPERSGPIGSGDFGGSGGSGASEGLGDFDGFGGDSEPTAEEGDGRRRRRSRNRLAVVDALLTLYRDGNLRPSTADVAERAGLSARSVFRYFEDVDDLCRAAVAREQERSWPLLPIGVRPDAPFAARVDALVAQRFGLFDAIRQVATVSRLEAPFHPALAEELARNRAFLRDQLRELFASELGQVGAAEATSLVGAADVLCSFESYHLLQSDQGLTATQARQAVARALAALFGVPG